jgi:hypothetical protein
MEHKKQSKKESFITWIYIIACMAAMFGTLFLFQISKKG